MLQSAVKWRLAVAVISAVIAVLFAILGSVVSILALLVALPFAIAAVVLFRQARARMTTVNRHRRSDVSASRGGRRTRSDRDDRYRRHHHDEGTEIQSTATHVSPAEARSVLDISRDADDATVRQAYRRRIKEVHPDQGGDEEEFRRVTAAYERLRESDDTDRI